jgi:2-polyprenyl-3-methyl-5-hydroxy-6-metoxy-1,4-benzoquinol methylase
MTSTASSNATASNVYRHFLEIERFNRLSTTWWNPEVYARCTWSTPCVWASGGTNRRHFGRQSLIAVLTGCVLDVGCGWFVRVPAAAPGGGR